MIKREQTRDVIETPEETIVSICLEAFSFKYLSCYGPSSNQMDVLKETFMQCERLPSSSTGIFCLLESFYGLM